MAEQEKIEDNSNIRKSLNNKKFKRNILVKVYAIVITLVLIALLYFGCQYFNNDDLDIESYAVASEVEDVEKLESGYMNITMDSYIYAEGGTIYPNAVNKSENNNSQILEIYDENNRLIYQSGLIPVGSSVSQGNLLFDLETGEHSCTAYFSLINEETGETLGTSGVKIIVSAA